MKIVIVEDEPKTGDKLEQGLSAAGFALAPARAMGRALASPEAP